MGWVAALFSCVLLSLPAICQQPVPSESALGEDLGGKQVDPFRSSQRRVTVMLFVRTDCPISNRYAPLLQKMSEEFRNRANFWLIYPDRSETASRIRSHLQDFHYSIPALRDTNRSLVKRAQATITPEAAVFGSTGRLLYHGRIDNSYQDLGRPRSTATTHQLHDAILAALHGKPVSPGHANAVGCYIADLQ